MIDQLIQYLQHEFFIMSAGVIVYFTTAFAIAHEKGKSDFSRWFQKSKIWILLTYIIGLMCIVWDDEILSAYNAYVENDITQIHRWMYFIAGPFVTFLYRSFTSNFAGRNNEEAPRVEVAD